MTTLTSYDLNGKKLSFANWISNLSPQETPFTSMTGKESVNQTLFQWQTDFLAPAAKNAQKEGTVASKIDFRATLVKTNITQILRKTVKVSDTANSLANYGRGKEIQYQMEKAGKEIKRDVEWAFLNNVNSSEETTTSPRKTAGFQGLVASRGVKDPDTGAIVHRPLLNPGTLQEEDIFDMTYNLYVAGSHAHIIMFHPKHASFFSSLQEKSGADGNRERIFENTPKFSVHVSTLVDPLGQEYKLIPNRWMPEGKIFFFCHKDWTQMVLRTPTRTKLAKDGSYEKWMIEMEVGLRHRNPYASGVLDVYADDDTAKDGWTTATAKYTKTDSTEGTSDIKAATAHITVKKGGKLNFQGLLKVKGSSADAWGLEMPTSPATYYKPVVGDRFTLMKDGREFGHWTLNDDTETGKWETLLKDDPPAPPTAPTQPTTVKEMLATNHAGPEHNGEYHLQLQSQAEGWAVKLHSAAVFVTVSKG